MAKENQQVLRFDNPDLWFGGTEEGVIDEIVIPNYVAPEEEEQEEEEEKKIETPEDTSEQEEVEVEEKEEENEEEEGEEDSVKFTKVQALVAGAEYIKEKFEIDYEKALETEEDVVEFFEEFTDFYAREKYETLRNTNQQVAKVFDILEEGGNVENLIELFKVQKSVVDIDITEEKGQKEIIEKYYTEIAKWDKAQLKRNLERWEANEELETEAKFAQEKYQEFLAEKQQKEIENQRKSAEESKQFEQQKINLYGNYLQKLGLKKEEITDSLKFAFQEYKTLPNKEKITRLEEAILIAQTDPSKLRELELFLRDSDKYIQTKIAEQTTKKSNTKFGQILENQVNKKGGNAPDSKKTKTPVLIFK